MSAFLAERLLQSGRLQNRIAAAVDDLLERRSVVLVASRRLREASILGQIRTELERRDRMVVTVSAIDAGTLDPEPFLARFFRCPAEAFTHPWVLDAERFELPEVVLVDEISATSETVGKWLRFLGRWATLARRARPDVAPAFALVVSDAGAVEQLPRAEVLLSVHPWWPIADPLEMRLLTRLLPVENEHQRIWREHHLAMLAPWEVELVEPLWHHLEADTDSIFAAIEAESRTAGISREEAEGAIALANRIRWSSGALPSAEVRPYWLSGLVEQTPEFGIQASVLAHARVGDAEEIRQRIWRAQVGLILPRIDRVRVKLCGHLTRVHGARWTEWADCSQQDEVEMMRRTPIATQIGHLKRIYDSALRFERVQRDWVDKAHFVRNELAHVRSVSFQDFSELEQRAMRLEVELSEERLASGRSAAA